LQLNIDSSEEEDSPLPLAAVENLERILGEELSLLCADAERYEAAEISVSFVDSGEMKEVNRTHRGVDEATDVLSFPMWEDEGRFVPLALSDLLPLGDILICPEEAAREHDHPPYSEVLSLMLAHGFLHLLAWDHDTPQKEQAMWERQELLKSKLWKAIEEAR
jgi:probable rRNA maturation factor